MPEGLPEYNPEEIADAISPGTPTNFLKSILQYCWISTGIDSEILGWIPAGEAMENFIQEYLEGLLKKEL